MGLFPPGVTRSATRPAHFPLRALSLPLSGLTSIPEATRAKSMSPSPPTMMFSAGVPLTFAKISPTYLRASMPTGHWWLRGITSPSSVDLAQPQ